MALSPTGTDPSSQLLLDPADLVTRLAVSADTAQRLAEEASAEVAGFFGHPLAYRTWEESFEASPDGGSPGLPLYLTARPVVAVSEILDTAGNDIASTSYRVDASAARISVPEDFSRSLLVNWNLGGGPAAWSVFYTAGWWLPLTTGTKPAGVPLLDASIARWAFLIAQALNAQEGRAGKFASFEMRGVKGTFRDPKAGESGYTVDPPASLERWKARVI